MQKLLRKLSQLHHASKLLQHWVVQQLEQTGTTAFLQVRSCLQFSAHPPSTTNLEAWTISGQQHQTNYQIYLLQINLMLAVSYHHWNFFNLALQPLQLVVTRKISMEIQHMPPRCFRARALVLGKVASPLQRPENLLVPMGVSTGTFLLANTARKVAWFVGSVCGSRDKNNSKLTDSAHILHAESFLDKQLQAASKTLRLVTTCVWCLQYSL